MKEYYDRRAAEYDDWYHGRGLFAARERPGWDAELGHLVQVVAAMPQTSVLDVGCGSGFLTRHLGRRVVGLDQSPSMLAVARRQCPGVPLVRADALALPFADASFGRVFSGHFYGHLQPHERALFLTEAGAVGDEIVVADAGPRGGGPREEWQDRVLRDGSRHRVFKRFFSGASLAAELGGGQVLHEGTWFVVVAARLRRAPPSPAPDAGWGE